MKVLISGTIAKDKKPDSGLDDIGDKLNSNRLVRMMVVGMIEFHAHTEVVGEPESVTIRFSAIEPLTGEADLTARELLDQARKARGVGSTELTLFDQTDDSHKGPWPGDVDYLAPGTVTADGEALETLETALRDKASEAAETAETAEVTFRSESEPEDSGSRDGEGQGEGQAEPEAPTKAKRAPRTKRALASVPDPKADSEA